jgi:hypothetical protein
MFDDPEATADLLLRASDIATAGTLGEPVRAAPCPAISDDQKRDLIKRATTPLSNPNDALDRSTGDQAHALRQRVFELRSSDQGGAL